ncbi:hypothetical protein U9M48_002424 [Paspalum notatum var. saurae]|uniref:RNase H type-1 domain-containing protein n=1 Tax=Paspalum notatum var. saurae TaxID=547442 RepID=A0AAQ3PHQ1_PASNO
MYAVLMVKRKLTHYFDWHQVTVVSAAPLGEIFGNRDAFGRIAKWAIELNCLDIPYVSRTAIKSQALADFVVEWTDAQEPRSIEDPEDWTMCFDGSYTKMGSEAEVVMISPLGKKLQYVIRLNFDATNNVAEYEALINGLHSLSSLGPNAYTYKATQSSWLIKL